MITFRAGGRPQTQGSKVPTHHWGPIVNGDPTCRFGMREAGGAKLKEWRKEVSRAAARAMKQRPPMSGPIGVMLDFYFERPASKPEELYAAERGRRDVDKLARAVLDACTDAAVWVDDGLVADLHVRKFYNRGEGYGVIATIREIEEALT